MTKSTTGRRIKPVPMQPCFICINNIVIRNTIICTFNVRMFVNVRLIQASIYHDYCNISSKGHSVTAFIIAYCRRAWFSYSVMILKDIRILCIGIIFEYRIHTVYLIKMKVLTYTLYKEHCEPCTETHGSIAVNSCQIELARKDIILLSNIAVIFYKAGSRTGLENNKITKFNLSAGRYLFYWRF